jgi:hypothetical protein
VAARGCPERRGDTVRIAFVPLLIALGAVPLPASDAGASEPVFPRGGFSVGVSGGVAILQMEKVNNFLEIRNTTEDLRFDQFSTGWDVEIDVRYAVSSKIFFGLQGGRIWAKSEDPISGERLEVSGNPLLLIAGISTQPDAGIVFRFVGGMGVLLNGQLKNNYGAELNGTGFQAQLGGELELRVTPAIGLALQGVARSAEVADPEDAQTGNPGIDLDFSGGTVMLGVRGYFGGKREP